MFIWRDDPTGIAVADALLAAADRGVRVSIAKDAFGWVFERAEENKRSLLHPRPLARLWPHMKVVERLYGQDFVPLRSDGEALQRLSSHPYVELASAVRRDHAKWWVFDRQAVITSGMNVENKHVEADWRGIIWRDYLVEISGYAAVRRLRARLAGMQQIDLGRAVEFVRNDRSQDRFEIEPVVLQLLAGARSSVRVEMAYVGENRVTDALVGMARAGVRVEILLPSRSNLQDDQNRRLARRLVTRSHGGVQVRLCPDMLHAKALLVDDRVALVGSANLTRQGLREFGELDVYTTDTAFVESLRRAFDAHWQEALRIEPTVDLVYSRAKAWLEALVC